MKIREVRQSREYRYEVISTRKGSTQTDNIIGNEFIIEALKVVMAYLKEDLYQEIILRDNITNVEVVFIDEEAERKIKQMEIDN